MKVSAIIVAAGSSHRMGFDKLEADLAGESVLARSMMAFEATPSVFEFRVVTSPDKFEAITATADRLGLNKFVETLEGGAERHLSVHAGLSRVSREADLVAVHDGARPLVTPEAISNCASVAGETGAAALAHRVADTLKLGNDQGEVAGAVSRDHLWGMQTPQIFELELLHEAYQAVFERGDLVTDEVSALEAIGHPVKLVENPEPNLKITVPSDLVVAEAVFSSRRGD
jgi:2-C-methyl-D-erythritol 4-phosphate cytidylyltransferase|tara:strand:+ start:6336 stop:7022 length:687 start_codon:yes stop_codon:yes gene_type:complete